MFEFKGDWETEIKLNEFEFFDNPEYKYQDSNKDNSIIRLEFFDERNENPDPEESQLNTVNYLLDSKNQKSILNKLLTFSKKTIYPTYKEFMWESEYPECYPQLNKVEDLNKLYGINSIKIKTIDKDSYAYYMFDCSSCLDYEHGIVITFYKDKIIDFQEDWDDIKVCEHKGIDYQAYHEKSIKEYNKRELFLVKPNPKYGKLKPYQKEQNEFYPIGLYHDGQYEKLIFELENGTIDNSENVMKRLLPLSIFHEKENFTQYLLPKFGKGQHSSFKYALEKDRFDIMEILIKQGYDINEQVAQDSSFYDSIREIVNCLNKNEPYNHIIKRLKFLLQNDLNPMLEDRFGRNAYFAIDRIEKLELKEKVTNILNQINNA